MNVNNSAETTRLGVAVTGERSGGISPAQEIVVGRNWVDIAQTRESSWNLALC